MPADAYLEEGQGFLYLFLPVAQMVTQRNGAAGKRAAKLKLVTEKDVGEHALQIDEKTYPVLCLWLSLRAVLPYRVWCIFLRLGMLHDAHADGVADKVEVAVASASRTRVCARRRNLLAKGGWLVRWCPERDYDSKQRENISENVP